MAGQVTSLHTYPVKSLRGLDHATLAIDAEGPVGDREFVVVDEAGKFLTQREIAAMALVGAVRVGESVRLSFGGRELDVPFSKDGEESDVAVWADSVRGHRVGAAADAFLSEALGRPVRLFRYQPQKPRVKTTADGDEFVMRFPDTGQVLLVSEESAASLAEFAQEEVPVNRFRANIVIAGFPAWAEETWKRVRIGSMEFAILKPCTRCKMITIDQATAEQKSPKPLQALKNGVKGPQPKSQFGMYLRILQPGSIRVGDPVEIL